MCHVQLHVSTMAYIRWLSKVLKAEIYGSSAVFHLKISAEKRQKDIRCIEISKYAR